MLFATGFLCSESLGRSVNILEDDEQLQSVGCGVHSGKSIYILEQGL
jgi:hypothetical protein